MGEGPVQMIGSVQLGHSGWLGRSVRSGQIDWVGSVRLGWSDQVSQSGQLLCL